MTAIRVAVNLLWCDPGRVGGSEQYLTRQMLGLAEVDPDSERVAAEVFASRRYLQAHPEIAARFATGAPRIAMAQRPVRIAAEHHWLPARTGLADLVHHGGGTMPMAGRAGRSRAPSVLTVHDLQYLTYPEYFSSTRLRYLRSVMPRSIRRATVVTTPSQYVKSCVVEAFGIDPARIVVVPHGLVDNQPRPRSDPTSGPSPHVPTVLDRYGLGAHRFIIYPAITHPHKNHEVIIRALADPSVDPELRLVLIGGRGAAEERVARLISTAGLTDRVIRPGWVSDADRDALLAASAALVFPSRYEGFGAPVIEAMALGTPVIASRHPALVEVGADAVLYASPEDPGSWVESLAQLTTQSSRLIDAGRKRSAAFGAAASAEALIDAYHLAVRTRPER